MRFMFALPLLLVTLPAHAIEVDQSYKTARVELMAEGWDPVASVNDQMTCSFRGDVCAEFPEVQECAPTGEAPCIFEFERDGDKLVVNTVGEAAEDLTVTSWK